MEKEIKQLWIDKNVLNFKIISTQVVLAKAIEDYNKNEERMKKYIGYTDDGVACKGKEELLTAGEGGTYLPTEEEKVITKEIEKEMEKK